MWQVIQQFSPLISGGSLKKCNNNMTEDDCEKIKNSIEKCMKQLHADNYGEYYEGYQNLGHHFIPDIKDELAEIGQNQFQPRDFAIFLIYTSTFRKVQTRNIQTDVDYSRYYSQFLEQLKTNFGDINDEYSIVVSLILMHYIMSEETIQLRLLMEHTKNIYECLKEKNIKDIKEHAPEYTLAWLLGWQRPEGLPPGWHNDTYYKNARWIIAHHFICFEVKKCYTQLANYGIGFPYNPMTNEVWNGIPEIDGLAMRCFNKFVGADPAHVTHDSPPTTNENLLLQSWEPANESLRLFISQAVKGQYGNKFSPGNFRRGDTPQITLFFIEYQKYWEDQEIPEEESYALESFDQGTRYCKGCGCPVNQISIHFQGMINDNIHNHEQGCIYQGQPLDNNNSYLRKRRAFLRLKAYKQYYIDIECYYCDRVACVDAFMNIIKETNPTKGEKLYYPATLGQCPECEEEYRDAARRRAEAKGQINYKVKTSTLTLFEQVEEKKILKIPEDIEFLKDFLEYLIATFECADKRSAIGQYQLMTKEKQMNLIKKFKKENSLSTPIVEYIEHQMHILNEKWQK